MYTIVFTTKAKKALRRRERSGRFPSVKFEEALRYFLAGEALPASFHDHALQGALSEYRELHLAPDVLVQYKRNEKLRIITIAAIGSHSDLFGT